MNETKGIRDLSVGVLVTGAFMFAVMIVLPLSMHAHLDDLEFQRKCAAQHNGVTLYARNGRALACLDRKALLMVP